MRLATPSAETANVSRLSVTPLYGADDGSGDWKCVMRVVFGVVALVGFVFVGLTVLGDARATCEQSASRDTCAAALR